MPRSTRLDQHELPLPADAAEWCPHLGALDVLAAGTYKLDEATRQRRGALHLFRLTSNGRLVPLPAAAAELPGIFDLRWRPCSPQPQLGAALADGSLRLLQWGDHSDGNSDDSSGVDSTAASAAAAAAAAEPVVAQFAGPPRMIAHLPGPLTVDDATSCAGTSNTNALVGAGASDTSFVGAGAHGGEAASGGGGGGASMAASLDFSRAAGSAGQQLVGSYSSGHLQLFQAAPPGWTRLATWRAHSLEAWVAATDPWHPHLIHSGGDDAAYKLWDSRISFLSAPTWRDRSTHQAGVCCVAASPHDMHAVVTGSYDDRLRLWDRRAMGRPLLVAELDAGGGVWRAKWHPNHPHLLLAACMYNGFAVVRVDGTTGAAAVGTDQTTAAAEAAAPGVVRVDGSIVAAVVGTDHTTRTAGAVVGMGARTGVEAVVGMGATTGTAATAVVGADHNRGAAEAAAAAALAGEGSDVPKQPPPQQQHDLHQQEQQQQQQQQPGLRILASYEHAPGSLSYGADWCRQGVAVSHSAAGAASAAAAAASDAAAAVAAAGGAAPAGADSSIGGSGDAWLAATASFYDRQLHLWRFQA